MRYLKISVLSLLIVFLSGLSGCFLNYFIPAPARLFTPKDVLIGVDELPEGWAVMYGPESVGDNTRSNSSSEIAFSPIEHPDQRSVTLTVYRYFSVEGAKSNFTESSSFPGETNIEGWSYESDIADEQKISCYQYPNTDTPVCKWVARYQEIVVELYAHIGDNRLSIYEMQDIVMSIDSRIKALLIVEND